MKVGDIVVISGIDLWVAHEDHNGWLPGMWVRFGDYAEIIKTLPWEIAAPAGHNFSGEHHILGQIFYIWPCEKFHGTWTQEALINIGGDPVGGNLPNNGKGWWAPKIYMSPYNQNKDPISVIRGVVDTTTKINKRGYGL